MNESFLKKFKNYFVKKRNEREMIKKLSNVLGVSSSKVKKMIERTQGKTNLIDIKNEEDKINE